MQKSSNDIRDLKKEALRFHAEAEEAKRGCENGAIVAIEKAWECGKRLNALKENVGFGNWQTWLENNLPRVTERTAQSYMKIDRENPNALRVADLKFDSIRKYRIASFVPEKDRPQLKGDKKFARSNHHLAVVLECNKLSQRVDAGQYDDPEIDRDFAPFRDWLVKRAALTLPG